MTNYAEKLMRKYRSSVENIKEDLIDFARRSMKKTDVNIEQHITDLDYLEAQGVDISDLKKELDKMEKRLERKQEVLNFIYKIKDKKDIMKLRLKILQVLGKTKLLRMKRLKRIKDTEADKERKERYVKWQERQVIPYVPFVREEGRRILGYWSDKVKPKKYVQKGYSRTREGREAIKFFKSGEAFKDYKGVAKCRICGETLGSSLNRNGKVYYPDKLEHYIIKHDVKIHPRRAK